MLNLSLSRFLKTIIQQNKETIPYNYAEESQELPPPSRDILMNDNMEINSFSQTIKGSDN